MNFSGRFALFTFKEKIGNSSKGLGEEKGSKTTVEKCQSLSRNSLPLSAFNLRIRKEKLFKEKTLSNKLITQHLFVRLLILMLRLF
jgi:hypothetical protein